MNRNTYILMFVCIIFAVSVFLPVFRHYQLRFAVEAFITKLKDKGEPMELAQVIPTPVPPEQNSAALFLKAASLLYTNHNVLSSNPPTAMRMVAPGKAMIGWKQATISSSDGTNTWEEVNQSLAHDSEAIMLLDRITNGAMLDFNLQYNQRFEMRLTHLGQEKKAAQRLTSSAMAALRSGDSALAVTNISAMLALVNGTREERTAISQLVRIAVAQITIAASWELLQSPATTDEELFSLQKNWSQLDFIHAAESVLPLEREGCETTITKFRRSNAELQHYFDLQKQVQGVLGNFDEEEQSNSIWQKMKMKTRIFLWRYWWSYTDELRYLKGYEALVEAMRLIGTSHSFEKALVAQDVKLKRLGITGLRSSIDSIFSSETDFHSLISESIVTLGVFERKVMRVETAKQVTIAAIALKRYQLRLSHNPPDLNSLVPDFLSTIPLDPVDGQPLRYRRNADGTFLIYSVGENGVDDGGEPSLEKGVTSLSYNWLNPHALDWVWPQPATEAEIRYFYEHPPK